ncbi:hypothetical protein [Sphingomonas immobilis]|uniref:Homogentisate 1,2-dioxygenase n=1 Tax=Sphingomonas immobilis TaxID=3063997 RepID=A0ABT9A059_9SPHN|nr:hypothetical protein [Sphingomonas sp. CA1-15]MDO7842913.1 hypothetical protein [Sphingomonas sp. CA1-15]
MSKVIVAAALAALLSSGASAQRLIAPAAPSASTMAAPAAIPSDTPCPPTTAAPSGAWAEWVPPTSVAAGGTVPALTIGTRTDLTLDATEKVAYTLALARPPRPNTWGGMLSLKIATAGTYQVALGTGAWIDVVKDGKTVASTTHEHGPPCSGIRKIVAFTLAPGDYTIQLSNSPEPAIGVMVIAKHG